MASRGAPPGMGQVMVLSTCVIVVIVIVIVIVALVSWILRLTVLLELSLPLKFIHQCYLVL